MRLRLAQRLELMGKGFGHAAALRVLFQGTHRIEMNADGEENVAGCRQFAQGLAFDADKALGNDIVIRIACALLVARQWW